MSSNEVVGTSTDSAPCTERCRSVLFCFSFSSWNKESDVYSHGVNFRIRNPYVVSGEKENPIVDLEIDDGQPVLHRLQIESIKPNEPLQGARLTTCWAPKDEDPIVMRRKVHIRSRDLSSAYPGNEAWAHVALIGTS